VGFTVRTDPYCDELLSNLIEFTHELVDLLGLRLRDVVHKLIKLLPHEGDLPPQLDKPSHSLGGQSRGRFDGCGRFG
jgi:hypothetical protein